jgi:hypothetical protein
MSPHSSSFSLMAVRWQITSGCEKESRLHAVCILVTTIHTFHIFLIKCNNVLKSALVLSIKSICLCLTKNSQYLRLMLHDQNLNWLLFVSASSKRSNRHDNLHVVTSIYVMHQALVLITPQSTRL